MQVNNYNIYPQNRTFQSTNSVLSPLTNFGISFKGDIKTDVSNFAFLKGLEKLNKFSTEEYKTLSQEEILSLRKMYERVKQKHYANFWIKCEGLHDKTAESIKETLDEKYGEGKYKVITIGRSLSSIGKVLGYKIGEENVINIPMSNAGQYADNCYLDTLKREGKLNNFRKFLAEQGLTKEKTEKSGKTYIIMDYCYSGNSLKGAKNLLTQDCVLGDKNITTMDIKNCIKSKSEREQLISMLKDSDYKIFSFVKRAENIEEIPEAYIDTQKVEDMDKRIMWFTLLDNQMTKKTEENKGLISFINGISNYFKSS